jgi:hypothetical protein
MWSRLPNISASIGKQFDRLCGARKLLLRQLWIVWTTILGATVMAQTGSVQPPDRPHDGLERQQNNFQVQAAPQSDSNEAATRIVHRTLLESVWGTPVFCEVRQTIEWFDKRRNGFGKYVRGGLGSGRLRMSLQIPAGDQMNTLLQVSDGELLTTFVSVGQHTSRTQVDLGKVRERLTLTVDSLKDPTTAMYLAIGGQAEALRKLCQQYYWNEVSEQLLGQQRVWVLTGVASTQSFSYASRALVDARLHDDRSDIQPKRAVLIIGHAESQWPFWLYQVEQWYEPTSAHRSPLYVITEWDSPTRLAAEQVLPDLFRSPAPDHQASQEIREETKLYLPPMLSNTASRPDQSKLPR